VVTASVKAAASAAETTFALARGNPTLCCGLTGQAVSLARYADATADAGARRRARVVLARAAQGFAASDAPTLHLWQGPLGAALVALQWKAGESSVPCFEAPAEARRVRADGA
jgi:hypothetical protein